ncbi:hypothetical protein AC579_9394, partial [Pseudocercospora musae]
MAEAIVPSPFILQPTFDWFGNDGNWSTFRINVGSPPQSFQVLPSTVASEFWVAIPVGCSSDPSTGCAASRGVEPFGGVQYQGFQANCSTTWNQQGVFSLGIESALYGPDITGQYGLDTVSFGSVGRSANLTDQAVGGIASGDFWLGIIGLATAQSDFGSQRVSSPLSSMKAQNLTPSASYGLSVGAAHRSSAGGIVIGGFDEAAFEPSNISFAAWAGSARALTVSLQNIVVSNPALGTNTLFTSPLNMSIDMTISQIWFPETVCESIAQLCGLTFDDSTDYFTFTIAANSGENQTYNIVLPYAAFDQQVGWAKYNNGMAYFPIRRARNDTQYVLGRTFLQEAYVVDWERGNFTLGQSRHTNGVTEGSIVPILSPEASQKSTLSTGALAGIRLWQLEHVVGENYGDLKDESHWDEDGVAKELPSRPLKRDAELPGFDQTPGVELPDFP